FRKAAEQQITNAEFALAIAYLSGQGVGVEPLAARFWLRRAAAHGDEQAATALPQIEKNFADLFAKGPGAVEGGDGASEERALLLPDAKTESQGIETEHAVVKFFFAGWTWASQAVMNGRDGHTYDQITLTQGAGATREIYFDISSWYGKLE